MFQEEKLCRILALSNGKG